MHSSDHSTKGTPLDAGRPRPKPRPPNRPPTAGREWVSGALSFPPRGAFHLSLTVLVPYRWPDVLSLGGWSPLLPTGFRVSRGTQVQTVAPSMTVGYGALTRSGVVSHPLRLASSTLARRPLARPDLLALQPHRKHLAAPPLVWARPGSLATTTGVSFVISLPPGTEMFQFPGCPPHDLSFQSRVVSHDRHRVAPFGFGWLSARMQLPIHVSPLSAPFIGIWPLGILPLPCSAWQSLMRRLDRRSGWMRHRAVRIVATLHAHSPRHCYAHNSPPQGHSLASAKLRYIITIENSRPRLNGVDTYQRRPARSLPHRSLLLIMWLFRCGRAGARCANALRLRQVSPSSNRFANHVSAHHGVRF